MRAMFNGLLRSSRPALVVAVLVGVVGLTGTAYAGKSDSKTAKTAKHHAKAKSHGHSKGDANSNATTSSQTDSKKSHGNDDGDWNGGSGYKHHKHHKVVPDGGLIHVDEDTPGITYSNPSVNLTDHGVVFGPFTNNSAGDQTSGGTVRIAVPAGTTLADIAQLEYSASFFSTYPTPTGDAPYLRVFIDNAGDGFCDPTCGDDDHDVVFSPSTQPGACYGPDVPAAVPALPKSIQCGSANRMIHYVVTDGTVRYDDDPGANGPDMRWGAVVNAHAADKVESIRVSVGNSQPGTTGGVLNSLFFELAGHSPTTLAFAG